MVLRKHWPNTAELWSEFLSLPVRFGKDIIVVSALFWFGFGCIRVRCFAFSLYKYFFGNNGKKKKRKKNASLQVKWRAVSRFCKQKFPFCRLSAALGIVKQVCLCTYLHDNSTRSKARCGDFCVANPQDLTLTQSLKRSYFCIFFFVFREDIDFELDWNWLLCRNKIRLWFF